MKPDSLKEPLVFLLHLVGLYCLYTKQEYDWEMNVLSGSGGHNQISQWTLGSFLIVKVREVNVPFISREAFPVLSNVRCTSVSQIN